MKYLIMFCGPAASGKTTEAKRMRDSMTAQGYSVEYVSRDDIRFSLVPENADYFCEEKKVLSKFLAAINNGLTHSDMVICDATHLNRRSRGKILEEVKYRGETTLFCLYLTTPEEIAQQLNSKREGRVRVPENIIHQMYERYEYPTSEELKTYRFARIEVFEKPWKENVE